MKLSRAVQEFIEQGRTHLTPATLAAYDSDLSRLVALASPYSVLAFTPDLVRAFPPKPRHLPRPFLSEDTKKLMRLELLAIEQVIRALLY